MVNESDADNETTAGFRLSAESARRSALSTQLAFLRARDDVSGVLHRLSREFSKLKDSKTGIGGQHTRLFLPQHHVLPREFREWFEQRGFTGDMSIDRFCVKMEQAGHEAIHGGGDWRMGRTWPGEWNQMIMAALRKAEARAGRRLTPAEVLELVAEAMKQYRLPMNFTKWRSR